MRFLLRPLELLLLLVFATPLPGCGCNHLGPDAESGPCGGPPYDEADEPTGCGGWDRPDGGGRDSGYDAWWRDVPADTPEEVEDVGPDVPEDADLPLCHDLGAACMTDRGCAGSEHCQAHLELFYGEPLDPVEGLPEGLDVNLFVGGMCTDRNFLSGIGSCEADVDACGRCGACVDLGPTYADQALCLRRCDPELGRTACREGYACRPGEGVCVPGCTPGDPMEAECRTHRRESNGIGGLQQPWHCELDPGVCGGSETNFDRLVYEPDDPSFCDPATFSCTNPGVDGAEAGDPCEFDHQCEPGGRCLGAEEGWPARGVCTKQGCEVGANWCAGDGVCRTRGVERTWYPAPVDEPPFLCLPRCVVASEHDGSPASWRTDRGGCAEGLRCVADAPDLTIGHCLPGVFSPVETPNLGAPCTADDECWSPFGNGACWHDGMDGSGRCVATECHIAAFPNYCGGAARCVETGADSSACLPACTVHADCSEGYACSPEGVCQPGSRS